MKDELLAKLESRLGRLHARQRLGIERDYEVRVFGRGRTFFHIENWYSVHGLMRAALRLSGLYWRGCRNACDVKVEENVVTDPALPKAFDGFTILQLSDLHVEMSSAAMERVAGLIGSLAYDICVLTGDYRAKTYGPHDAVLAGMEKLVRLINKPAFGILGNHDTVRMLPGLEELGIRILMNEAEAIERDGVRIHLIGVDDPHYFRAENIEKAAGHVPAEDYSILLSHSPELYAQAAHSEFNLTLCGHTHGGQICLPGGFALKLNAAVPRYMGAGAWKYHDMAGYTSRGAGTSIVAARFNCPPEITLHRLKTT